ncbi:MAG TPA: TauD/TfdA family dioxygenase [Steroidobacteraceae bacterium]|nr:TauD/TfdA family dioxygenase [Steroidobacteraceae bacterium]
MSLDIRRLGPSLGAEIRGVDLAQPVDADTVGEIARAFDEHGVLVFRGQAIDDRAHARFAAHFGPLGTFRHLADPHGKVREIFRLANTDAAGNLLPADDAHLRLLELNGLWHSDSSYRQVPTRGSVLRAVVVPDSGGDTLFADMAAAYETLPATMRRRIAGLYARHSLEFLVTSRGLPALGAEELARIPPVEHPLVREHASGRCSLFLSPPYMEAIVGWSPAASRALIAELTDWATRERYTYRHHWQRDDLVMWDNGWTMHKVLPYDIARCRRVMHGTTLLGGSAHAA